MVVIDVCGELRWADGVSCESAGAVVQPKTTDLAGDAEVLCFLNEARVGKGQYNVPHYVIQGYYHDDGPPSLEQIVEGCRIIREKIEANKKVLVIAPSGKEFLSHRPFSALCVAAYPLLMKKLSLEAALAPWAQLDLGFRQHSWANVHKPPPSGKLSLTTCLTALDLALRHKWLDVEGFDAKATSDLCAKWDAAWVIPGEVLLLADPMTTVLDPDPATASHLVGPTEPNFADWFKSSKVHTLVRLNKDRESGLDKSYEAARFVNCGMEHVQAAYDDTGGGVPSQEIVKKVIQGCSTLGMDQAVAFHCKAGFGRSGICAAIFAIHKYDLPGESMLAWLRICRPGTITTMSQTRFLQSMQGRASVEKMMAPQECCAIS